jgi:hypothetical protein
MKRIAWRPFVRALHRDAGYTVVGLTLIYAISGLAVNHIGDWDPSFENYAGSHELGPIPEKDDAAIAMLVRTKLAIKEEPSEVYRASDTELDITFAKRSLHVNPVTGHIDDEGQKPRFFLRLANWLHLNRGKKQWRYVADTYAVILLYLATSGIFMLPGKKGFAGRGAIFVALGVLIPAAYVVLSGGP